MNRGVRLLDAAETELRRYIILPSEDAYVAMALWVAATHGVPAWNHATRAALVSPIKRCGKTRVMEITSLLSNRPMLTIDTSAAALFRQMTDDPPSIFHDEADVVFSSKGPASDELRGFYNGGYSRDGIVRRVSANRKTVLKFPSFAMAMLASIGDLPDTIMDRSVVFRMRRRSYGEYVEPFRQRDKPPLRRLGARLHKWVRASLDELREADPYNPLEDRAADTWEPLLAIAELAGQEWPERAQIAAKAMTDAEEAAGVPDQGLQLLHDIREVWNSKPAMHTTDLVNVLVMNREYGWEKHNGNSPISAKELAALLRPYEIKSQQVKIDGTNRWGYRKGDFEHAWERYLDEG